MQPGLRTQRPAQPLLSVTLIVGSLFLALSLFSYSPTDPSWSFTTSADASINNLGGIVGSWIADGLLQLIGVVSYILIFIAFTSGLRLMQTRTIHLRQGSRPQTKKQGKWRIPVAVTLSSLCLSGLLSLLPFKVYGDLVLGGAVGHLVSSAAVFCFSHVGSVLLFLGGIWASSVLAFDKALPNMEFSEKFQSRFKNKEFLSHAVSFVREKLSATLGFFASKWKKFREKPSVHTAAAKPNLKFDFNWRKKPKENEEEKDFFSKPTQVVEKVEPVDFPLKESAPTKRESRPEEKSPRILSLFEKSSTEPTEPSDRKLLMKEMPSRRFMASSASEDYDFPSLQLLDLPQSDEKIEVSKDELIENSKALEQKLLDFGIQGRVKDIRPGPIITLYEFEPAPGVKVKNITNLTDDLKLAMKAVSIRIIAPIPGKSVVGIEIPNKSRQNVYLREVLESPLFQNSNSALSIAMGKATSGEPYVTDLAKMPHLLVAGATGSGKSVGINTMITSMLYKAAPDELKFIMIDPKMLELSVYEGIPHLLLPVVTDPKKAARALKWAVKEMERRYKLISALGARNLKSYNQKVEKLSEEELQRELELAAHTEATTSALIDEDEDRQQELALQETGLDHFEKLPQIVVVIDELADLIMVAARDVEESIARLAQMARAAGIHLIIATQRPSVDVITGVIKANLPTRCAFQVASKIDSRTIIDGPGAENLIGQGDMLFLPPGTSRLVRLHGAFISEDEISSIVKHLKSQGRPEYAVNVEVEEQMPLHGERSDDEDDELWDEALTIVFETKSPSASMLQRRLRIGYNRAARLIEKMEEEGIVSAPLGSGKGRELLVTPSHDG